MFPRENISNETYRESPQIIIDTREELLEKPFIFKAR